MHKHKKSKSNVVKFPIKPKLQQDWEQFISCDDCRGNVDKTMDKLANDEFVIFDLASSKAIQVKVVAGGTIIVLDTSNSNNEYMNIAPQKI